ncbi:MAG: DUF1028 domain-containing protein [Alphaproteobacteria bacterium]|jgi:uncharacterized Ntn-hydrolase superfamily protein|nr:DUF1028 domain-containing protein [Alphaproteobacteria bacterium]
MTFSILSLDEETGTYAAAAATGSLCVGGWVLRGCIESGLVASQGTAPSTFWRDEALRGMHAGGAADRVVADLTGADPGNGHRQMIALDRNGRTGGHTGAESIPYAAHDCRSRLAVAGNMLTGPDVLEAMIAAHEAAAESAADRMLQVLAAADEVGGDMRGLQSAALLILSPDRPPLDLRVDYDPDPVNALRALCERAHGSPYHDWLAEVPVLSDRFRAPR